MAVRIIVRKLSSKCAIDTPTRTRDGDADRPHDATAAIIQTAMAKLTIRRGKRISTPSDLRIELTPMAKSIRHDSGHNHAAFDDVLNVRIETNERRPARHDAENDRPN